MDKQEAIERLKQNKAAAEFYAGMVQNTNAIESELKDIEAIDMAIEALSAERTGEWIPCTKEGLALTELMRREGQKWFGYKCSKCNFIYKGNALTESPFCQDCGARMKG